MLGGMLSATVLAIFFVPVLFVFVLRLLKRTKMKGEVIRPALAKASFGRSASNFRLDVDVPPYKIFGNLGQQWKMDGRRCYRLRYREAP